MKQASRLHFQLQPSGDLVFILEDAKGELFAAATMPEQAWQQMIDDIDERWDDLFGDDEPLDLNDFDPKGRA